MRKGEKLISSVFEADQEYIRINLLCFTKSRPLPALVPFIHKHKAHTPFSVLNNRCSSTKKQQNNNNKRTAAALATTEACAEVLPEQRSL